MHSAALRQAKKKALMALVKEMRKEEMKGSGDDEEPKAPVALAAGEDDVLEPDMSDLEDVEGALGEAEEPAEDDPKALLEEFMKKGGRRPSKSRATVVMAMKSPVAAKMKKTFAK